MTPPLVFAILGSPRTKKNSRVHTGAGVPLPSKAWRYWRDNAVFAMPNGTNVLRPGPWQNVKANCRASFYIDANRRTDLINLLQGLGDLLQDRGVISDDSLLAGFDGSRVYVDRVNPRTEVELTVLG